MHIIPLESYRTQLSSPAIYSHTDRTVRVSYHRTTGWPVECTGDLQPSQCRPTYQICKNLIIGRRRLEYQWHKILVSAGSINDISHGYPLCVDAACKRSKQLSLTISTHSTKLLSHTVTGHSRLLQSTGLSIPTRCMTSCSSILHQSDTHVLYPIQAFGHHTFKKMLDIASWASKGVTLPTPRRTQGRVIHLFKEKMYLLWEWLNVCPCFSSLRFTTLILIWSGPHCSRRNQSDLWRMASWQHRCMFCCHRTLDQGACPQRVDSWARPTWFCSDELLT